MGGLGTGLLTPPNNDPTIILANIANIIVGSLLSLKEAGS